MNRNQLVITSAVVAGVIALIVVLLATGNPPPDEEARDATGDVEVGEGVSPPSQTSLVDITDAKVHEVASQIVFEATMDDAIPRRLKDQTMEWRWELSEEGTHTWTVTASINVRRPVALVLEQQSGYSASTIDDTLAGGIDYTGNTLYVRLNRPEIPNFPDRFTWHLKTTLDADRGDPASATATDEAPASGLGEYPPPR